MEGDDLTGILRGINLVGAVVGEGNGYKSRQYMWLANLSVNFIGLANSGLKWVFCITRAAWRGGEERMVD